MTATTTQPVTAAKDPQIALTILEQLGGRLFLMLTGSTGLVDSGRGLQLKIGSNAKRVTHMRIDLADDDTYSIKFYRVTKRGLDITVLSEMEMINAEQLKDIFEEATGLYVTVRERR